MVLIQNIKNFTYNGEKNNILLDIHNYNIKFIENIDSIIFSSKNFDYDILLTYIVYVILIIMIIIFISLLLLL